MSLEAKIQDEIKAAMLAREKVRLEALRAIKAAILLEKTSDGAETISDDAVLKIIMKLFKKMTGYTCVEYVNSYRLKECAERLLSSKDKILDIAYECGFNHISYFNLQFRKVYGMTPKEYRAMKGQADPTA